MSKDAATHPRLPMSDQDRASSQRRREALERLVSELNAELDVLEQASEPEPDQLAAAVDDLVTTLQQHVEEAEAPDGLLGQIVEVAPWFGPRVDQLRQEHDVLLGEATTLQAQVRSGHRLADAVSRTRELAARVDGHRHQGTSLLMDAYMLDIPESD